ncbi:MAG: hypothetical protein K0R19_912 [Bacillota bacterium]|jgi:hypothetical protein|nr:hypothetical protein [Bacillota bacterium]
MNKNGRIDHKGELRIDELLGDIYETETMNLSDGSELLQDRLTEEEKGRIFSMIQAKLREEAKKVPPLLTEGDSGDAASESTRLNPSSSGKVFRFGRRRRILIASLVALCAFASTAFAAEIFHWDSRISNYFGMSDQNQGDLNGAGMNVGVRAEDSGVTIEAVQTIGDASNMYILLNITVPEGQILNSQTGFDMIYLKVKGATGMGYSCDQIPDEDPSDNKGTLLFSMEANSEINDKDIELKFVNMRHYDMDSGEMVLDYEGEWLLNWKLAYQDVSRTFEISKDIEVNGETVRVDSISISPIAFNVKISGDYIRAYDSVPPNPEDGELIEITSVKLKDGTILTKDDSMGWGTSIVGSDYVINMKMRELLDPKGIDSIILNHTEIKL